MAFTDAERSGTPELQPLPVLPHIPTAAERRANAKKLEALRELKKRNKLAEYRGNFELFCNEQVKVLPKDASVGFIPLYLNEAQKIVNAKIEEQLKATGKVRAIILKARQMGLSTYTASRVFWKAYLNPYHKSVILAHDAATADALFTMSKNIISRMIDDYRPEFKKSNAKEIQFLHNDSGYRLYTAGSGEAGRGSTPTVCHMSEVAFWQNDESLLAGLFQGISQADGTEVILESTANGIGNAFHRLWNGAVEGTNEYVAIFVPWFLMSEYRREAPKEMDLTAEEESLMTKFSLNKDQLYWRRLKIAESGELKFKQEYPSTPEEAFLVSGSNVFNVEKLNALIPQPVLAKREFDFDSCMFDDIRHGSLEIFKYPTFEDAFAIGADVSLGVGRDFSTAVVMNKKKEVCAIYHNNTIDPSQFGDLLFYLGRYYNNALLAVESNSMGIATLNRLAQMSYINMYYQTKMANVSKEDGTRMGWRTTSASKPAIIGFLKSAIEQEEVWIPSRMMIQELMNFVVSDTGKTGGSTGNNDDSVIALAIVLEVIRTHGDRLTNNRVPFTQKLGDTYNAQETSWL